MQDGWIKMYWKTKDSIVGSNFTALGLWTYLLLSASATRRILRNGEVLEPGEAIVSAKELAKRAKCSDRTIQRFLKTFEEEGMISVVKVSRNGTHLSICNWATYQQHNPDAV